MKINPLILGNPKIKIPMIAKGKWPRTTAVILMNLSMEPLNIKFQSACKKAANSTAKITKVSVILKPNYKFLKELGLTIRALRII